MVWVGYLVNKYDCMSDVSVVGHTTGGMQTDAHLYKCIALKGLIIYFLWISCWCLKSEFILWIMDYVL